MDKNPDNIQIPLYDEQEEEKDSIDIVISNNFNITLTEKSFEKNNYKIEYKYNLKKKCININNNGFILYEYVENNSKYFIIEPENDTKQNLNYNKKIYYDTYNVYLS